ncbi:MAG: sporulation protein YunB [Paenibacillaceae bacterium]
MARRWRSGKRQSTGKKRIILVILFLFAFSSLQTFIYVERNLREPLMNVAAIRVKQKATEAINTAITEKMAEGTNFDKLIDWKEDNSGKITGFMLNYAEHMKIAGDTVNIVQNTLQNLQDIPEHIPLGLAFDSAILASFGPNIPLRFVPAGAVKVDLNTRQKDAGINMLLVEVYIRIIAEVTIIIPFETKPEVVSTEIPISYLLVVGDVPMYYFDGKGNPVGDSQALPPNIALPGLIQEQGNADQTPVTNFNTDDSVGD